MHKPLHEEIQYCPLCGGSAKPDMGVGVGFARCEDCGEGFWVEQ